jgi:hypothetical protein
MNRDGIMHFFATGSEYEHLGSVEMGEAVDATPAFVDGSIFIRGTEKLYRIGEPKPEPEPAPEEAAPAAEVEPAAEEGDGDGADDEAPADSPFDATPVETESEESDQPEEPATPAQRKEEDSDAEEETGAEDVGF